MPQDPRLRIRDSARPALATTGSSGLTRHSSLVTRHSPPRLGFTLIELMVVLAVIALLLSIVVPHYAGRVTRAEEAVLQENLTLMRDALDKHYADTGRYPDALEDLVAKRYLRGIPHDPVTQSNATWIAVAPADRQKGGVYDVRSGAKGTGSNGKPYEQW